MSTDISTRSTRRTKKGSNVFRTFLGAITNQNEDRESEDERLYNFIEDAKQEWIDAQSFFDSVTDPELIDYAIHKVDAAQRRYIYLLNQIKHSKIIADASKISM